MYTKGDKKKYVDFPYNFIMVRNNYNVIIIRLIV